MLGHVTLQLCFLAALGFSLLSEGCNTRLSKARVFTKLDIHQAFHWIHISPESEELTAFYTCYGLFQYKVLPFGLTNGPVTFQSYINNILRDLLDIICTAYLDNILIYYIDELEYKAHVK